MKKALKLGFFLIAILGLLVGAFTLYVHLGDIPSYEVKAPIIEVAPDSVRLARGELLVNQICANCHRGRNNKLEGAELEQGLFGEVYAPNITNHPEYGIGRYTDGELAFLLRTGIKRNGQYTPPYMPKFPHMSDEDLFSIIAYLRSDAPPVQASDKVQPTPEPAFTTKMLCHLIFKPLAYPDQALKAPSKLDKAAYGKYLATAVLECYTCHSKDFKTNNLLEPEKSAGYMGGGTTLHDDEGRPVFSSNITLHPSLGIGSWTKAQFVEAVKFGRLPDGTMVSTAMPKYTAFPEEDIEAIWAYLNSLPVLDKGRN